MYKTALTALERRIARWDQDLGHADFAGPQPRSCKDNFIEWLHSKIPFIHVYSNVIPCLTCSGALTETHRDKWESFAWSSWVYGP